MPDKSKLTLEILQDDDLESPRESMDNLGVMVCFHGEYVLGDKIDCHVSDFDGWSGLRRYLVGECGAKHVLPLYLMDHSSLSMSTEPFGCGWDSGQVGWIYTTDELMDKVGFGNYCEDDVKNALRAEVRVYNQYLAGDVWGYTITDGDGDVVDSCWGFYGHDAAEEEGKAGLEYLAEQYAYVRKLVQDCYDDHKFLVEVVEGFAQKHTYEEYLAEFGEED